MAFVKINDFPDYSVNKCGIIFSQHSNKILKNRIQRDGYNRAALQMNKKRRDLMVHRLVAEAFIPNPENKPEVNHIDGNKLNNHIYNLEWCTKGENEIHAHATGLKNFKGERGTNVRLKWVDIRQIRYIYKSGLCVQQELADLWGISQGMVYLIVNNLRWQQ